jgi:hypothetical protein
LPQGDVERRLERVVEDCIARAVGKISENKPTSCSGVLRLRMDFNAV